MKLVACLCAVMILFDFSEPVITRKIDFRKESVRVLRKDIISRADSLLNKKPVTITSFRCERSAGGIHDFYSEGDYWWPDPENAYGPYVQRDGMTNPENFVEHRKAMIRLSRIVGTLASAYKITGDEKYVIRALEHLRAWFVDKKTMMNPSLLYAQAVKGRFAGRGIGIIDTIQLMEVAQAVLVMEKAESADRELIAAVKSWFSEYLKWLMSHKYSRDEMNARNNHATCWVMQVASFARLTEDNEILEFCRNRYRDVLLPGQMAADGSFPEELKRTKPYGYSIFNLDAMTMVCLILTDREHDMINFTTQDGKCLRKGIEFLYPYVAEKSQWNYPADVMYFTEWPVAQPFLFFGALSFGEKKWFETWKSLEHFPEVDEVIRNLPVRNPVIWMD